MDFQAYSSFEKVVVMIIIVNVAVSFMAFGNFRTFEKLKFRIGDILGNKEYYRLLTSAFTHVNYFHLFLNMFVLNSFSEALEYKGVGVLQFLIIYFVSLFIGNLLPLFIHKNNANYSAVGASGAVSGVLYASIYLMPYSEIGILFIPIGIPAWIFGILYLVYTVWAAKKGTDNVGHDAHFGGAVAGLLIAMFYFPEIAIINWKIIVAMFLPIIYFLFDTFFKKDQGSVAFKNIGTSHSSRKIDDLYNSNRRDKIIELNEILDKVRERGIDSLSSLEKNRLDILSKELD